MVVRDDGELLQAWTDGRSAGAFEEIVRRYIDMVYATAVRSLGGDRLLADDVTQAVFLILSKKARSIHSGAALGAWLHQTTRFAAANARKMQSRRRRHEHIAATQRSEVEMMPHVTTNLHGDLDAAIASLNAADRAAVVARYLKGQDLITIASDLGISPDAVQKRLERSVQKLRDYFIKHRIKASTTGVAATLTTIRSMTAPPVIMNQMVQNIVTNAHSGSVTSLASSTMKSMTLSTAKTLTAYACGALAGAAVIGFVCFSFINLKPNTPAKHVHQVETERLAQK